MQREKKRTKEADLRTDDSPVSEGKANDGEAEWATRPSAKQIQDKEKQLLRFALGQGLRPRTLKFYSTEMF